MSAKIIDGKQISKEIRENLKQEIIKYKEETGYGVGLAVVLVGENDASKVYVRNKINGCEEVGIKSYSYHLPEETTEAQVLELIDTLNADDNINGILVQLPLPKHINETTVLNRIDYKKDVDGFLPMNMGNLALRHDAIFSCTPYGIIQMLKHEGIEIAGKNAVVVGRSNIVGKPMALLLLNENATVTICHSKTRDLKEHTLKADILVAAVGISEFITGDMVKEGAVVMDVGMNRKDGKLTGDVNFEEAKEKASYITPVPGGVYPMTITTLLCNTLKASKLYRK